MIVFIGKKEYNVSEITYKKFMKLSRRHSKSDAEKWTVGQLNSYVFDGLWFVVPRWKFFFLKKYMISKITMPELKFFQLNIMDVLLGKEDGEMGK
jgi:hypothetical protein